MPKKNYGKEAYGSGSSSNGRYMGMIKGKGMNKEVMKSDGNVFPIETTDAQKFDMGRMKILPMERRGYPEKAFDYKY